MGLIADGGDVAAIAGATSVAAASGLERAQKDAGLGRVIYLLAHIPLAGRKADFEAALEKLGIEVPTEPSVFDLTSGLDGALRTWHRKVGIHRSDLAIMAHLAATEALNRCVGNRARSLFPGDVDVPRAVRGLATAGGFAELAHEFFSRFTRRYLLYHLDRELPLHAGGNGRFSEHAERRRFDADLETHCREAALIVRDYAGVWHGKANFEDGITPERAQRFADHCLKKIAAELAVRGGLDG